LIRLWKPWTNPKYTRIRRFKYQLTLVHYEDHMVFFEQ